MSEVEFQRYWVEGHAVNFAVKIPQIRKYIVDTRVVLPGETGDPLWCGVAEIWLSNEQEQVESLQTPEFLQGARLDEPSWAAFWRTLVVDTTAHPIVDGPDRRPNTMAKLLILTKRREGVPLELFRSHVTGGHAQVVQAVPGLRRYQVGLTTDGAYGIGEAVKDAVEQLWFDDVDAALAAQASPEWARVNADYETFIVPRYRNELLVRENWILGPELRPYPPAG
jgi:uncharacterized protein (TIGR02118 family)